MARLITEESIVFFGSGPVAAASLEQLAKLMPIEAIITKPATETMMARIEPASRLFTVSSRSELDELMQKERFASRLGVLVDFGVIIGETTIAAFPLGILNSHFSLLPEWRGADPISFAILSGQSQTGVSIMLIVKGLDEGPILAQTAYRVRPKETTSSLTDALIELSVVTLREVIPLYLKGTILLVDQANSTFGKNLAVSYSHKLTKEDGVINWQLDAEQIERQIRAYLHWPKSTTTLGEIEVILMEAEIVKEQGKPGIIKADNRHLIVYCGKDALEITKLKPAGKSQMSGRSFLAGYGRYLPNA